MISIDKEEKIRSMVALGETGYSIAKETGISTVAVRTIRNMMDSINEINKEDMEKIKNLLIAGIPAGAIEMRLKIPKAHIVAVRRYYYLSGKRFKENPEVNEIKCPSCGSIKPQKIPKCNHKFSRKIISRKVTRKHAVEMYRIMEDILNMYNSSIMVHPLFHNLVQDIVLLKGKVDSNEVTK